MGEDELINSLSCGKQELVDDMSVSNRWEGLLLEEVIGVKVFGSMSDGEVMLFVLCHLCVMQGHELNYEDMMYEYQYQVHMWFEEEYQGTEPDEFVRWNVSEHQFEIHVIFIEHYIFGNENSSLYIHTIMALVCRRDPLNMHTYCS